MRNLPSFSSLLRCLLPLALVTSAMGEPNPVINQADYFKLNEGDEWTVKAEMTSGSGEKGEMTAKLKVEAPVEREGKTYFPIRSSVTTKGGTTDQVQLFRRDDTGAYSRGAGPGDAKETVEALFPLKVGATWNKVKGSETFANTLLGVETVKIGDKTYEKCLHIKSTNAGGTYTEESFEAPNVGTVKMTVSAPGNTIIKATLVEFKAGPPKAAAK